MLRPYRSVQARLQAPTKFFFWPVGFNAEAYTRTLANPLFLHSLLKSVERTLSGTLLSMALTVTAAYVLSRSFRDERFIPGFSSLRCCLTVD